MVLLGAPTPILFPRAETVVPTPHFCSMVVPCWTFFPPGLRQLSSPFFLASVFFFPFHVHFFYFTSISTVLLFLPFPFLYYLPIPLPFLLFSHFFLFPFLPSAQRLHPTSKFQCYWIAYGAHLLPPLDFSIIQSTLLCSLVSQPSTW